MKAKDLDLASHALLSALPSLEACRDFRQLFELVRDLIEPIPGIGELMIYDTALRIGAKLNLKPMRVYLHAGARAGARALDYENRGRDFVHLEDLPEPLRQLEPHEIEDCLCIFKADIQLAACD